MFRFVITTIGLTLSQCIASNVCAADSSLATPTKISSAARTCKVVDHTYEEARRIDNAILEMEKSGQYRLAAECVSELVLGGYNAPYNLEAVSIYYSKAGMCQKAELAFSNFITLVKRNWIESSDRSAAQEPILGKDWTNFSNRLAIRVPYEDVHDPGKERILEALAKCRKENHG